MRKFFSPSCRILLQSVSGAFRSLYLLLLILASGFSFFSATAQPPILNEDSQINILPGGKIFRWYGKLGRTYFIQGSDENSPLAKWKWAPVIESGNDQYISHEIIGTAPQGYFRLQRSDQPIPAGLTIDTADFDNDGLTNLAEITPDSSGIQTDPLDPDTDHDGLTDKWERDHGLDPTDDGSVDLNNGPNGDPDGDGLSNIDEQTHGTDPNAIDTDGDGANDGDEINSGHDPLSNQSYPPVWRKAGRYIARDIGIVWTYAWWDSSLGSLHYEETPPGDYAVILSQDIVFPTAPPSQDFFKPQEIVNGGSCAYGVFASLDHTRYWLETKPALTADYKISVIQQTERGPIDTFETTATTTYELKVITIHANDTLSDPIDVLPTFTSDNERVETILLPVEVEVTIPNEVSEITPPILTVANNMMAADSSSLPSPADASSSDAATPEIDINVNSQLLPNEKKMTEGGWVVLNFDDDDARGNYEHGNTSAIPDLEFTGAIANENDMIRVGVKRLAVDPSVAVKYRFKYGNSNIRLWKKSDRTEQVISEQTEYTIPVNEKWAVAYVEGIKPHDDDAGTIVTVQVKIGTADWLDADTVKIRVAHPIIVLYMEGRMWSRSDAEPVAEFAKGRITKGPDGQPDPIYLRKIVNSHGDTFLIPGTSDTNQNVCYSITGLFDRNAYKTAKLALKTEGTHIAFNGHANWGVGFAFGTNFADFNQFYWAAGGGQASCSTEGFHEHLQLSPTGPLGPNFAAAQVWNQMHDPSATNRMIQGIPLPDVERFPNNENPVIQPGQAFAHQNEALTSNTGASMNLLYHYLANPAVDGDGGHDHRSILRQPGNSDVPVTLKYKSLMLTQCSSYRNYIETFKHGRVIGSWKFISDPTITRTYVKDTVDGIAPATMKIHLNLLEKDTQNGGHPGMFEISEF